MMRLVVVAVIVDDIRRGPGIDVFACVMRDTFWDPQEDPRITVVMTRATES